MKVLLLKAWIVVLLFSSCYFLSFKQTYAQLNIPVASIASKVQATIGNFYFSAFGLASPHASIVLTSDGIVLRATVADANGNFSIPEVLIRAGFSHFCFDVVDFRRLGESETCLTIPPAQASVVKKDIFLPPTLGLSRTQVNAGASVTAFGYTMPGALVTLYINNGQKITVYADATGYYQFILKDLKAGQYSLYSKAEYKQKESLTPTKQVKLKALSWGEQVAAFWKDLWNKFLKFLKDLALGPLWLVIPLFILIIILIVKLLPGRFGFIHNPFKKRHPLHHKWWMGY